MGYEDTGSEGVQQRDVGGFVVRVGDVRVGLQLDLGAVEGVEDGIAG